MKIASLLSRIAAATSAVALGLALLGGAHAVTFFAIAAGAFVTLIAARDYAPRARRWQPAITHRNSSSATRKRQSLRLAA